MVRRFLSVLLLATMGLSVAACGGDETPVDDGVQRPQTTYEHKFLKYMDGSLVPEVGTWSEWNLFPNSIWGNRHRAQVSQSVVNFRPSRQPFSFTEAHRPTPPEWLEHFGSTNTDAFILVDNGAITHEFYAVGMHPPSGHLVSSALKSWTSAVVSRRLGRVMESYIPALEVEFSNTVFAIHTVRDLVDMRLPTLWREVSEGPGSETARLASYEGVEFTGRCQMSFFQTLENDPLLAAGDWNDSSASTLVMAYLGAKLGDTSQREMFEYFFDLIGLEHPSGMTMNECGEVAAEGLAWMSLRDFAKLPYAISRRGRIAGRQVIEESYIDDIFAEDAAKARAWKASVEARAYGIFDRYSNQWYVVDSDIAFGIGSGGQMFALNRANRKVAAKFSTYEVARDAALLRKDVEFLLSLVKSLESEEESEEAATDTDAGEDEDSKSDATQDDANDKDQRADEESEASDETSNGDQDSLDDPDSAEPETEDDAAKTSDEAEGDADAVDPEPQPSPEDEATDAASETVEEEAPSADE